MVYIPCSLRSIIHCCDMTFAYIAIYTIITCNIYCTTATRTVHRAAPRARWTRRRADRAPQHAPQHALRALQHRGPGWTADICRQGDARAAPHNCTSQHKTCNTHTTATGRQSDTRATPHNRHGHTAAAVSVGKARRAHCGPP